MTTQAKHTPGPWRANIDRDKCDSGLDDIRIYAEEDRGHPQGPLTVARINQHLAGESMANARLMAAAPDLLEALRGAVGYAEMEGGFCDPPAWYIFAKNAIDRAEGRAGA